jgi:hypothetical protein
MDVDKDPAGDADDADDADAEERDDDDDVDASAAARAERAAAVTRAQAAFDEEWPKFRARTVRSGEADNALDGWRKVQLSYPMLAIVARVALSAAATEFAVERLFSYVRHVMTDFRSRLSDEHLAEVMMVMANGEMVDVLKK